MIFLQWLKEPWPWYVAGPLIGLTVPLLFILGNKSLGVSASFRHICAASISSKIGYFQYDWKKEVWNLLFVGGIIIGAFITVQFFNNTSPLQLNPKFVKDMQENGLTDYYGFVPHELFNWEALFTLKGFLMMIVGGFAVGFGTRYAGGCTSGHSITGLSTLQLPSLVATICFMAGGFLVANLIVPVILKL